MNTREKICRVPKALVIREYLLDTFKKSPLHNNNFKPVDQNGKIHQIISSQSEDDLLDRDLSCYNCDDCFNCAVSSSDTDTIENLVDKNMVIAVLADHPNFEYYLLKVISGPESIEARITDEWGCTFDRG